MSTQANVQRQGPDGENAQAPQGIATTANDQSTTFDAVVVGAGFGGLRMLHELRELGLSAQVIEAASDVGGTWYWNRYPGARTDSESWVYAFSFSRELQDEWNWTERYPTQPEVLTYLRHVVDRFDMRKDIQFNARVAAASFDEASTTWTVTTDQGDTYRCTYLITSAGVLSTPYKPDFPGLDDFTGEWYLTGRWPHERVDFTDKRVAVIGTGATAVQAIPIIAHTAKHLTVFQRTPNYVLPARNYLLTDDERQAIRTNYDEIWRKCREHFYGFPWDAAGRTIADVTPEEHQKILEGHWEVGGIRFLFSFDDIWTDEASNDVIAEFIRDKIRAVVHDPATAELLCPKDYPLAGKRPPLGHFYYETFNRDNVSLVDVSDEPISGITPGGVRVGEDEFEADVIVFATGFDAVTGSYAGLDIRGRDGVKLTQRWREGPKTQLGITVDGFPNLFMICGPQTPFSNMPVVIDGIADWIGGAITHLRENSIKTMEPTSDAVEKWSLHMEDLLNATVLPRCKSSWFLGANIPGKPYVVLFHFGGLGVYREACQDEADRGYQSFTLTG